MQAHRTTQMDSPDTVDSRMTTSVRERHWQFAPGQIVSLAAGLGFLIVGIVALLRAGIGDDLSTPVVEVLGFTHTAWLGLAEIGVGLFLIAAGADYRGRAVSVFIGAALVVAGVVIASAADELPTELGIEEGMGVPLAIVGGIVALSALVLPAFRSHHVDEHVDDRRLAT